MSQMPHIPDVCGHVPFSTDSDTSTDVLQSLKSDPREATVKNVSILLANQKYEEDGLLYKTVRVNPERSGKLGRIIVAYRCRRC